MEKWHERFKELRLKKKMSQGKMARALGIDASSVSRYERGRGGSDLTDNLLLRLEKFFTEEEVEYIKSGKITDDKSSLVVEDAGSLYRKHDYVEIPYYENVYASAGGGSDSTDGSRRSPVSFSRDFLNNYLGIVNVQGLSIINAAGDSMDPTIRSGELMFVAPMDGEEFKDGGIYVIMCGNALLVKRVTFDPVAGEYTLHSDNGKVAPVKLRMDEADECRFVGRVVGHMDRV